MHEQPVLPDWRHFVVMGAVLFPDAARFTQPANVALSALWKAQQLLVPALCLLRSPRPQMSSHLSWHFFLLHFLWDVLDLTRKILYLFRSRARQFLSLAEPHAKE